VAEIFCDEGVAVRMNFVPGVTDLDAGAGIAALSEPWRKRKVELARYRAVERFEGVRILPIQFRHPQIDVVLVVKLNIPGIATSRLRPEKARRSNAGVEGLAVPAM